MAASPQERADVFAAHLSQAVSGASSPEREREMLAIIFDLERFHHHVYGRPVVVHSDHKPLEAISVKNLANAPLDSHACFFVPSDTTSELCIVLENR